MVIRMYLYAHYCTYQGIGDDITTTESVLNSEVSSFQGLLSVAREQMRHLGLTKCPVYGGVLNSGVSL